MCSVEMYSSPRPAISRSARWRTLTKPDEGRVSGSASPLRRGEAPRPRPAPAVADRGDVGAELWRTGHDEAVLLLEQGEQEVGGGDLGLRCSAASRWAAATASWDLIVKRSGCMRPASSSGFMAEYIKKIYVTYDLDLCQAQLPSVARILPIVIPDDSDRGRSYFNPHTGERITMLAIAEETGGKLTGWRSGAVGRRVVAGSFPPASGGAVPDRSGRADLPNRWRGTSGRALRGGHRPDRVSHIFRNGGPEELRYLASTDP